jgi:hypothetical protein
VREHAKGRATDRGPTPDHCPCLGIPEHQLGILPGIPISTAAPSPSNRSG